MARLRLAAMGVLAAALTACAGGPAPTAAPAPTGELRTASDTTSAEKRAGIRLQLAVGYFQEGKYEVALDEIKQALAADPQSAEAYGLRGLVYNAMGETARAENSFKEALALAPGNPDLQNNYGSFLCQTGRAPESIRFFEAALNNRSYRTPASALVNAGTCSLKMKNNDAAERYLLDALRVAPDLPVVNASLARIYHERRDSTRAGFFINRLTSTAKLDSLSADVLWLAIRVTHKAGDRTTEASLVSQLAKRFPSSPEYAAFQRGAFDE